MMTSEESYYWQLKVSEAEMAIESEDTKMFVSLGGVVQRDGNMYGAIIGTMPENYCGAFEKTRLQAVLECMKNFKFEEAKIPGKGK